MRETRTQANGGEPICSSESKAQALYGLVPLLQMRGNTPMSNYTTTRTKASLIEMFIDETAGEVYNEGRLATVENEGRVQLVAYGHEVIAEVDGKDVTLFTGHYGEVSKTVSDYIADLGSILNDFDNRNVDVRERQRPTLGIGTRVSDSAQYINQYIKNFRRDNSPVEQAAVNEVNRALSARMAEIFG